MFTRASVSLEIATEVMRLGCLRGHTVDSCGFEQRILEFVAEHPSAEFLDGWISAVREYGHENSSYAMAFIYAHRYLRELFPADVVEDFFWLGCKSWRGELLISFVAKGQPHLTDEQEDALPVVSGNDLEYFSLDHWAELVGDF